MEKKIEFKTWINRGVIMDLEVDHPEYSIPISNKVLLELKPTFKKPEGGGIHSDQDYHVTLSPACPERSPQGEPDYEAMIDDLTYLRERCSNPSRPKLQRVIDFLILEAKHIPQGDQTGVKKEET